MMCNQLHDGRVSAPPSTQNCVMNGDHTDWCCSDFALQQHNTCEQRRQADFDVTMVERFMDLNSDGSAQLCDGMSYATILRNPLARAVSHVRNFGLVFRIHFWTLLQKQSSAQIVDLFDRIDNATSVAALESILSTTRGLPTIDDLFRLSQFTGNYMVRFFTQRGREIDERGLLRRVEPGDVKRALDAVARYDLLLTDDMLGGKCATAMINRLFNASVPRMLMRDNSVYRHFQLHEHSLVERNKLDLEFYWHARRLAHLRCSTKKQH